MSKNTVADLLVQALEQAGVGQVYGVAGDRLNGFTEPLHQHDTVQWVHMRHEAAAARWRATRVAPAVAPLGRSVYARSTSLTRRTQHVTIGDGSAAEFPASNQQQHTRNGKAQRLVGNYQNRPRGWNNG